MSYHELFIFSENNEFELVVDAARYAEILQAELLRENPFEEKLHALKYLLTIDTPKTNKLIPPAEQLPQLTGHEYRILSAFSQAMLTPHRGKGYPQPEELLTLANISPPPSYTNYALSLYYSNHSDRKNEISAAKTEIAHHPSTASRNLLIDIYSQNKMYQSIQELLEDPNFSPLIDNYLKRDIALQTMDWPALVKSLIPVAYSNAEISMVCLALLTGVAWTALLLRFNGTLSWSEPAVKLAIPALLLGILSTHLTILVIYFQEDQLGLTQGNDLVSQALYCFAGIGLREEFLKLICFIPLIPFLTKRRNDLEILIVASLVGLGFAVEENISYLQQSQGISAYGRFITANFLHLALTGVCGLTLCQAFMYRGSYINTAVSTFGLAVLAHGGYDAFIIVPELSEYSIATSIIFVLIAYQYFIWLRHLRQKWNDPISLTSQFTLSIVLVLGMSYLLLTWQIGPIQALKPLIGEVLGLSLLLILFYREIPEQIQ